MLEDLHEDVIIRNYIIEPLSYKEISDLLKLLDVQPLDIIRQKEPIFQEHFAGKKLTKKQWIDAMVKYPILIERPIVVKGNKAVIGRPASLIKELITKKNK